MIISINVNYFYVKNTEKKTVRRKNVIFKNI